jgi:Predicted membrane protein
MNPLYKPAELLGRVLLALMFVVAGAGKISAYAGTQAYMHSAGVPGALLPLVILTEIGGGILIVLGWQTRIVAFLLAGFTALALLIFHHHIANQTDQIIVLAELGVLGGFLLLVANGAGPWSLDARLR